MVRRTHASSTRARSVGSPRAANNKHGVRSRCAASTRSASSSSRATSRSSFRDCDGVCRVARIGRVSAPHSGAHLTVACSSSRELTVARESSWRELTGRL